MKTIRPTLRPGAGRIFSPVTVFSLVLLGAAGLGIAAPAVAVEPAAITPFHMVFSSAMFTQVNEADAKASIKVWAQIVGKERGIAAEPHTLVDIVKGPAAMIQTLRAGLADAVVLPTDEYAEVSRAVAFSHLFIATHGGEFTEEYVVLVHRDSAVEHLVQLQGRELLVYESPLTCLAELWLDTQLLQAGRPAVTTFFGRIQHVSKLSKVILPVFFRQADACLATRRGFETMSELNPQIRRQLRAIATSPAIVPTVICIRADFRPASLEKIVASLRDLHTTPTGQQILTIFQSERIEEDTPERLVASLAVLTEHHRVVAAAIAARTGGTAGPSSPHSGGSN